MSLRAEFGVIYDKMEEKGFSENILEKDKKLFKAVHKGLKNYIAERYNAMLWDLKVEKKLTKN